MEGVESTNIAREQGERRTPFSNSKLFNITLHSKQMTKDCLISRENMDKEERCFEQLASQYKFYISFENSLCDEYVTEKLTRALESNLVPIVMGGVDYKRIAPPNSFINVDDFPTVKALADYLRYLDRNEVK